MKILGIESSGLTASVAVVEDDLVRAEFTLDNKLTHSETLLPMIKNMCALADCPPDSMDAVAISSGPGSFTGLRIGAATAKAFTLALNIPLISVPTLEALGMPLSLISDKTICPSMDARRHETYAAAYDNGECVIREDAYKIDEYLGALTDISPDGKSFLFVGDGIDVFKSVIMERLGERAFFAGAGFNRQRAGLTAGLGLKIYREWLEKNDICEAFVREHGADGDLPYDAKVMNGDDFAPHYIRKSQAERKTEAGELEDAGKASLRKIRRGLTV